MKVDFKEASTLRGLAEVAIFIIGLAMVLMEKDVTGLLLFATGFSGYMKWTNPDKTE